MDQNSKSLWQAVKIAKDVGISTLPKIMKYKDSGIERSDCFAGFFRDKIDSITSELVIDPNVYNGPKKLDANDSMFMTSNDVLKCIKDIN